jgi:ribosomal-protein-alanine N-acetyltransferase
MDILGYLLIGTICLWNFSADHTIAEIGYELEPAFQGKGLMSEAVQCVIDFGFNSLHLKALEAFTHKDNTSSMHVLLKNNFQLDPNRKDEENEDNRIYILANASKEV